MLSTNVSLSFISIPLLIAVIIIIVVIRWLKPGFLQFKKTIKQKPEGP